MRSLPYIPPEEKRFLDQFVVGGRSRSISLVIGGLAPILAGIVVGLLVDRVFGIAPYGVLVFIPVGLGFSVYRLAKLRSVLFRS